MWLHTMQIYIFVFSVSFLVIEKFCGFLIHFDSCFDGVRPPFMVQLVHISVVYFLQFRVIDGIRWPLPQMIKFIWITLISIVIFVYKLFFFRSFFLIAGGGRKFIFRSNSRRMHGYDFIRSNQNLLKLVLGAYWYVIRYLSQGPWRTIATQL